MIEDFNSQGQIRSSIPIQFLSKLWTPNLTSRTSFPIYPDWFGQDLPHEYHRDHAYDDDVTSGRNRRSNGRPKPAYCDSVPSFSEDTPIDGSVINISNGKVTFSCTAISQLGSIYSFSYQAPVGLTCTDVNPEGTITCEWNPSADQFPPLGIRSKCSRTFFPGCLKHFK